MHVIHAARKALSTMIGLFRASAIALALLWANWRNVDAIGEIFRHWRKTFMPVLVGLADELYVSCRTCSSRSFRILLMSFGREPVGNPLGTRWEPGSRRGFAAGRRLLAGCAPGRDLVNSPAVDESICSASLK